MASTAPDDEHRTPHVRQYPERAPATHGGRLVCWRTVPACSRQSVPAASTQPGAACLLLRTHLPPTCPCTHLDGPTGCPARCLGPTSPECAHSISPPRSVAPAGASGGGASTCVGSSERSRDAQQTTTSRGRHSHAPGTLTLPWHPKQCHVRERALPAVLCPAGRRRLGRPAGHEAGNPTEHGMFVGAGVHPANGAASDGQQGRREKRKGLLSYSSMCR